MGRRKKRFRGTRVVPSELARLTGIQLVWRPVTQDPKVIVLLRGEAHNNPRHYTAHALEIQNAITMVGHTHVIVVTETLTQRHGVWVSKKRTARQVGTDRSFELAEAQRPLIALLNHNPITCLSIDESSARRTGLTAPTSSQDITQVHLSRLRTSLVRGSVQQASERNTVFFVPRIMEGIRECWSRVRGTLAHGVVVVNLGNEHLEGVYRELSTELVRTDIPTEILAGNLTSRPLMTWAEEWL